MKHVSQTVNITVPVQLLKQVDALAKRDFTSRSDIIRQALLTRVRQPERFDEWGSPASENWQTVVDFREPDRPQGIPMTELIGYLEELEAHDRQEQKATRKASR